MHCANRLLELKNYLFLFLFERDSFGAGFLLPGAAFAVLYLLGCNSVLVVVLLVLAVAAQAFGPPGFYVNHLDLAPSFAGSLPLRSYFLQYTIST